MIFMKNIGILNDSKYPLYPDHNIGANLFSILHIRIMNERPVWEGVKMDFLTLRRKLSQLDAACICDANKRLRVMDPEIRPICQGLKMVGIARTVFCESDFLTVIKALHDAEENEVLIIDAGARKIALAGELFTTEAKRKKLSGIVIDGGCRDIKQLRKLDFPVYARFVIPLAGTVQNISKIQAPVTCGGVTVSPGDIIFGDDDGIVVLTEEECVDIIDIALNIQKNEEKALELIAKNQSLIGLMNFKEHFDKISKGKKSKLVFKI
jgi:4-hydroxy-4-methyl-2-oxoglutarate aldolase